MEQLVESDDINKNFYLPRYAINKINGVTTKLFVFEKSSTK